VRRHIAVRTLGKLLFELTATFGVVLLLFASYLTWGRTGQVRSYQDALNRQLAQAWDNPTLTPATGGPSAPTDANVAEGSPIGRLYIPRLNLDWVVVQGISDNDIRWAPGHYPGTAMPGAIGNFAVAGHRQTGLFWDLDQVRAGDFLVVQTDSHWYVYQVSQNQIVSPTSVEVLAPTPNQPGVAPSQPSITLTTCNPKWDNYQRMVVQGTLIQTTDAGQRPSQLNS
jgi:sortase A